MLARGTSVGRYVVLDLLGAGGMGEVYSAFDPQLDRRVALKLLRADRAPRDLSTADGEGDDAREVRLLREAQAMARLAHPNVVTVFDVGAHEGRVFIALELVDGRSLRELLREGALRPAHALELLTAAGRGLAAAHQAGIVHRDFKPDNVLVGPGARVRVTDFGLARSDEGGPIEPAGEDALTTPTARALEDPLTQTGSTLGTPGYISPEQFIGEGATARSDQFSFCVTLYEAFAGTRPFDEAGMRALAVARLDARAKNPIRLPPLRPPREGRAVPSFVMRVVEQGLSANPEDRFASMEALLAKLGHNPERRRRQLAAAAGLVLCAVAAAVGATRMSANEVCGGAPERLRGVWDAQVRGAIAAAFAQSQSPVHEQAFEGVARALDGWAASFSEGFRDACEATRMRAEQPESILALRMACLERRLLQADALTSLLQTADRPLVERAVEAAAALPRVERCANIEALTAILPPPDDPAVKPRVEAVRAQLARGQALLDSGRFADALPIADAAVKEARSLNYRAAEAEAMNLLGWVLHRLARHTDAERAWSDATFAAISGRHDEVAIRAATELVFVTGYDLSRSDVGHTWRKHAEALLERFGPDDDLRGKLLANVGVLYMADGDLTRALAHYERALALREKVFGKDHLETAKVVGNMGLVLARLGRHPEALAHYERALAIQLSQLGEGHPAVANSLVRIAGLQRTLGQFDQALLRLQRAQRIRTAALGDAHLSTLRLHSDLSRLYDALGKPELSRKAHATALEVARHAFGDAHPDYAETLRLYGEALQRQKALPEALAVYEEVVAVNLRALGEDAPATIRAREERATLLLSSGRARDAAMELEQVLSAKERVDGPSHPRVAHCLWLLGEAQFAQRAFRKALAAWERALQIAEPLGWHEAVMADLRFDVARALIASGGDRARARELADHALATFRAAGATQAHRVDTVEAWRSEAFR